MVKDKIATLPNGNGLMISPTIVATKIANKCQAFTSSPDGGVINHKTSPIARQINKGINFTSPAGFFVVSAIIFLLSCFLIIVVCSFYFTPNTYPI